MATTLSNKSGFQVCQNTGDIIRKPDVALQQARLASPWQPVTNTLDLKHLGKLAEELSELGQVVARCIIQGVDEVQPVTGKSNKLWLEEEVADVYANLQLVRSRFKLDDEFIEQRVKDKRDYLRNWHEMV